MNLFRIVAATLVMALGFPMASFADNTPAYYNTDGSLKTAQNDVVVTSTIGMVAGGTVAFPSNLNNAGTILIWISGTWTGTFAINGSIDGTTYLGSSPLSFRDGTGFTASGAGLTSGGTYIMANGGYKNVRVNGTAGGTGTMNVTIVASSGSYNGIQTSALSVPGGTATNVMNVQIEPIKGTYFASALSLAGVAGDTFVLTGSASKTLRIRRVTVSGLVTTAAMIDLSVIKRTTADTAGTAGTAPTIGAMDSNNSAASGTVAVYTAAPTAGTSAGTIFAQKYLPQANTVVPMIMNKEWFSDLSQAPVLRGVAQQLAINLSAAPAGGSWDISIEWTEE